MRSVRTSNCAILLARADEVVVRNPTDQRAQSPRGHVRAFRRTRAAQRYLPADEQRT